MRFAPSVRWRVSKRGLVIAGADGDAFLLEHPRAADLPDLLAGATDPDDLIRSWGPGTQPLVDELVGLEVLLTATSTDDGPGIEAGSRRRVRLTRSGIEIDGIEGPARAVGRALGPLWRSWPGRAALLALIVAGASASCTAGRTYLG